MTSSSAPSRKVFFFSAEALISFFFFFSINWIEFHLCCCVGVKQDRLQSPPERADGMAGQSSCWIQAQSHR